MVHREPDPDRSPAEFTLVVPAVGRRLRAERQPVRFLAALVGALVLHAAAFAATVAVFEATFGGGGQDLDVIEISLVPGEVLEAPRIAAAPIVTGGFTIADKAGSSMEPDAVAGSTVRDAEKPNELAPPAVEHANSRPTPYAERADDGLPQPVTGEAPSARASAPAGDAITAQEGGAADPAAVPAREDAGAASAASPREIDAYNRSVALTLSRLKPRGVGETGTAKVVFRIGTAGTVDDVRIAASTGKSKLDRLATETVARARFDTPPTGMTSAQLTYAIAFRFR